MEGEDGVGEGACYDNLKCWDRVEGGRKRFRREGTCVYLWLILIVVRQKPTQCCKAIILQVKIKKKIFLKEPDLEKAYVLSAHILLTRYNYVSLPASPQPPIKKRK